MKHLTATIYSFILILAFSACQQDFCFTKEQFLESYDNFISEIDNKEAISTEDKANYEARFQDLVEKCYKKYKPEMSLKEKQNFWKSSVTYYLAKEGDNISINISKEKSAFEEYVESEISEVITDSSKGFLSSLETLFDENLPNLFHNIADEIEKFADELESELDDN